MVTVTGDFYYGGHHILDFVGLSSDTKPSTDICNGSTFLEMDTRTVYIYDEENKKWLTKEQ